MVEVSFHEGPMCLGEGPKRLVKKAGVSNLGRSGRERSVKNSFFWLDIK